MIAANVVVSPVVASANDTPPPPHGSADLRYELRFQSLFNEGRALVFPCDAGGHVVLDELSERARENYLYARAVVGREFAAPAVIPSCMH